MLRSRLQRARTLTSISSDSLDEIRRAMTNMANTVAEQARDWLSKAKGYLSRVKG